jgi:hypothetical protein
LTGELPAAARRLFPHCEPADLALPAATPFVVGRLLEDGDRADLAWLFGALPEAEVAAWLASRGGRQLSRRSRAFWGLVVGPAPTPDPAPDPAAAELWPL